MAHKDATTRLPRFVPSCAFHIHSVIIVIGYTLSSSFSSMHTRAPTANRDPMTSYLVLRVFEISIRVYRNRESFDRPKQ